MKSESPEVLELYLNDALFRTVELLFAGSIPVRSEDRQAIQDMTSSLAAELRNLALMLTPATLQNHTATMASESVKAIRQTSQTLGSFALMTMLQAIGAGMNHRTTPLMLLTVSTALEAYVGPDPTPSSAEPQLLIPSPLTAREAALVDVVRCVAREEAFGRLEDFPEASESDWNRAIQALASWISQTYADLPQMLQEHTAIARELIQILTARGLSPNTILDITLRSALLRASEDVKVRNAPHNVSLLLALRMFRGVVDRE